ncbi:conserved hypothetical protein [Talaromyces stipitatus ATCC 10500]|uniref:NACHT domain-containing protein n=1 Tax=Talaromyces stipitatus (strain ATCC 10500 / CBS 375.48 / QM 6759 / NRRL 1006) TaxID=441959 RepID=B8MU89_TALSN|nr:uncharacterized protein TSTA_107840 [Talaromyces stipitatus ATCC 10500]EED11593.1 conserved hypothetical protein [Talaromyces stipitatus ATCC 10500]
MLGILKLSITTPLMILRLVYSKNARFNSNYRQHAQICHKNTRTDLLRDIYNWVDGKDERHIFWFKGLAGTGKSTIAQTVAKHYYDLDRRQLAASFFFARGGGDASHAGLFATSIAVQLANDVPLLRDVWRQLVLQPFSSLEVTHSLSLYLIVIDALDECNSKNDIQTILQLLSEARQFTPLRLRFLLTSRPDTAIRRGFSAVPTVERRDTVLHEIAPAVVDHDIALYLNHELAVIGREQYLGPDWPTQWQVQQLVSQSSGLFIWAATACRFICEGRNHANEQLSKVLKTQTRDSAPEKELDAIYTLVLMDSVPENLSDEEKGISYGLQY